MFDLVSVTASDLSASVAVYEAVLERIGAGLLSTTEGSWRCADFEVRSATPMAVATRRLHIGFAAPSHAAVEAFWHAGLEAGCRSLGDPGLRPVYSPSYYGAFVEDPDGNSIEAVHREGMRTDGVVDHLWLRVGDLGTSRGFYEEIGKSCGFRLGTDTPERAGFNRTGEGGGAFSLVPGEATTGVTLRFAGCPTASRPELDPGGNTVQLI